MHNNKFSLCLRFKNVQYCMNKMIILIYINTFYSYLNSLQTVMKDVTVSILSDALKILWKLMKRKIEIKNTFIHWRVVIRAVVIECGDGIWFGLVWFGLLCFYGISTIVLIICSITASEQYVIKFPGLQFFWFFFIKPCSFSVFNFSCVNCPSLMSNCLQIISVNGSCVSFVGFQSRFSKCCFLSCIRSSCLVAFSLAFAVLFLLFSSFTVVSCYLRLSVFNPAKNLIDLILYAFCLFFMVYVSDVDPKSVHRRKTRNMV